MTYFIGEKEKRNIGLGLRSNRGKGKEASGYTRRVDGEKSEWFYSTKLQEEVWNYMNEFPELMEYLYDQMSVNDRDDRGGEQQQLKATDVWPGEDCKEQLQRLTKFRSELPCCKVVTYKNLS